ncbi:MAG: VOC family protein [Nitrososphaera sp.]|nr:VOC family protein [Nitrososphaera sp.]
MSADQRAYYIHHHYLNRNQMETLNLKAKEILTFIPSGKNYKKAIEFYLELGFQLDWQTEDYCSFGKDNCRFLLQNNPSNWGKDNFMMVLEVENLDDWWKHLVSLELQKKYDGVKLRAPENYPWGNREIHLIDPCEVLWHISVPA